MPLMDDYLRQYGFVLLLGIFSVLMPAGVLAVSWLASKVRARPHRPNPLKYDPYECGMVPEGNPRWERHNVRFYRYGLLFLLFDVEAVFLFPWASQAGALGWGALGAVGFFIAILVVGLVYEWRAGGLSWDEAPPAAPQVDAAPEARAA